jgi:hypothetical protein
MVLQYFQMAVDLLGCFWAPHFYFFIYFFPVIHGKYGKFNNFKKIGKIKKNIIYICIYNVFFENKYLFGFVNVETDPRLR